MTDSSDAEKVEAAWCLNNISAGTDTQARAVIDVAGDALIKGLSSGNVPLEASPTCDSIVLVSRCVPRGGCYWCWAVMGLMKSVISLR